MNFLVVTIQLAFRVLRRNPLRAGLTMLGIIIGVGAVVAMVSLGQGASASVQSQIASLGTNVLIVIPGATTVGGVRSGLGGVSTLTVEDAREIERKVDGVSSVTYATRAVLQVVHEHKNWNTVVLGTTSAFPDIRDWPMAQGSFFTQAEEDAGVKVAVIGKTAAENLFEPGEEIVGGQIRIRNVSLRIVGVLASKGQTMQGQDQDDIVVIPFSTAERKVLGTQFLGTVGIMLAATERRDQIPAVVQDIKQLLRARHRIPPTISEIEAMLISIMNILLVSVTERTREIGVRMAVGAKRRHILLQFLIEATIMSTVGGAAGILAGIAGAYFITTIAGWPTIISMQAVVIAFLFSTGVGIFFGLYPANKASRLNPIEALRYE